MQAVRLAFEEKTEKMYLLKYDMAALYAFVTLHIRLLSLAFYPRFWALVS